MHCWMYGIRADNICTIDYYHEDVTQNVDPYTPNELEKATRIRYADDPSRTRMGRDAEVYSL